MKNIVIAVSLIVGLSGCGLVAQHDARMEMMASKEAYKNCLASHSGNIGACAAAKQTYDLDRQDYEDVRINPRHAGYDVNINTQPNQP